MKDEDGDKITFKEWDPADDIKTKKDVEGILEVAIAEKDPEFLAKVIGHILRSKGLREILKKEREKDKDETPFLAVFNTIDKMGYRLIISEK